MFSMESSAPGSLPSISCIVADACISGFLFLSQGFYLQSCLPLGFFIISTSIFRSWMDLFNSITSLVVFPCNSLWDFCLSSLRSSTCVAVISYNSLRESSCFLFKCFYLFSGILLNFFKWVINALLNILYQHHEIRFEYCFSGVLSYSGLTVVGILGSDDAQWSWFLLVRFFRLPFAIW